MASIIVVENVMTFMSNFNNYRFKIYSLIIEYVLRKKKDIHLFKDTMDIFYSLCFVLT